MQAEKGRTVFPASVAAIKTGDRVRCRDRCWVVHDKREVTDGQFLFDLKGAAPNGQQMLSVVVPPDCVEPLPNQDIEFDVSRLSPIRPWRNAHRALAATAVKEAGLLSGARFGRVALEAYQLAPALRILSKPKPSLLIADDVGPRNQFQRRPLPRASLVLPPASPAAAAPPPEGRLTRG